MGTCVAVTVTAAGLAAVRYESFPPRMDTSDGVSLIRAASVVAGTVAVSDARNQELGFTLAYVRDRAAKAWRGEQPGGWTFGCRRQKGSYEPRDIVQRGAAVSCRPHPGVAAPALRSLNQRRACRDSKIVPLSYSHNTGVNGPEEFKLIVQQGPRRRAFIWGWAAASGVIACSQRRTYETAGHRQRRTDTGPFPPTKALLTRYRYLRCPGSPSLSWSPRRRSRILRRTSSSGEPAYSGARHVWDCMWRGPYVTKPPVSDNWAHLVAYSRPPLPVSFHGCTAHDAWRKPAARDHRRHASSRAPCRGLWPLQALRGAPEGLGGRRAGSSGGIRPNVFWGWGGAASSTAESGRLRANTVLEGSSGARRGVHLAPVQDSTRPWRCKRTPLTRHRAIT